MKKLALTLAAAVLVVLATNENASAELPQHLELKTYFEMDVYVSKTKYPTVEAAIAKAEASIKGIEEFFGFVSASGSTADEWKILVEVRPKQVTFDSGDHIADTEQDAIKKTKAYLELTYGYYWQEDSSGGGSVNGSPGGAPYRHWIAGRAYHPDFSAKTTLVIR